MHKEKREMFYKEIEDFWHDLYGTEYALYDVHIESSHIIDSIKEAANQIGELFFKTAPLLRSLDDQTLFSLGFPKDSLPYLRLKTMETESVISRLDFAVTTDQIKLLELNADTPTFIKELFHVNELVCRHFQVQNPNKLEEKKLALALKHAIFEAYNELDRTNYPNVVFSSHDTHEEDKLTTLYLMKLADVDATYVPLSQLRIVPASTVEEGEHIEAGVYDQHGQKIDVLYRQTYPLEHLIEDEDPSTHEKVGHMLLTLAQQKQVAIINPPSAFLLQSKAVQALIWALHEQHHPFFTKEEHHIIETYFLPTYLEEDPFIERKQAFVKKPSFGREGDTVEIYNEDGIKIDEDQHKTYQKYTAVYQQFIPLPTAKMKTQTKTVEAHIMYGCFLLNGKASAVGIRAGNQITDNESYYLPIGLK